MGDFKNILFDAGFTLVRIHPSLGSVYARVADRLGTPFPADRFQEVGLRVWNEKRLPHYRVHLESSDAIERQFWWDYNQIVLAELAKDGFHVEFEPWFDAVFEIFADPETWTPMRGAAETLEALAARGHALAVVSNWDSRLIRVLDGLDLSRHFRFVLTSAEAGYRKPSPHIFEQALTRLGATAEESLYVGDSEEDDVAGAHAVGIQAVRIVPRHARREATADSAADHVISGLPELVDIVDGAGGGS
jgi:putative hydrolase of the HAD superfamily